MVEMSPAEVQWGALTADLHSGITSEQGSLKDRLRDLYGDSNLHTCVNLAWDTLPALPTTNVSQSQPHIDPTSLCRGVCKRIKRGG